MGSDRSIGCMKGARRERPRGGVAGVEHRNGVIDWLLAAAARGAVQPPLKATMGRSPSRLSGNVGASRARPSRSHP